MRRLLYISPYFPPQSRVGALRPLKFARHLPNHGWAPVVLCDLREHDAVDHDLLTAVPTSTTVVRDYGRRASRNENLLLRRLGGLAAPTPPPAPPAPWATTLARWGRSLKTQLDRNPELIPLGEHSPDIPHAVAAGRRILARTRCDAILVNADPYAATLVGKKLSQYSSLPLVLDFRDPWAPCELRRPLRPLPQRAVVDRLERLAVEAAARVILNTDASRDAYVQHYRDLPSARFITIRNHSDADLIASPPEPTDDRFTLLVLGNLRRFVEGDTLFDALTKLKRRGHGSDRLRLRVVGRIDAEVRQRARQLEVEDLLEVGTPVSYTEIGGVMQSADVLLAVSHSGRQRIPAKLYDYLTTSRPILAVSDNPEIKRLLAHAGVATVCALGDADGVANAVEREVALGRQRDVERLRAGTDSATATARLAETLDAVSA